MVPFKELTNLPLRTELLAKLTPSELDQLHSLHCNGQLVDPRARSFFRKVANGPQRWKDKDLQDDFVESQTRIHAMYVHVKMTLC